MGFSELLFILNLSHSKPFHNTLNYTSTTNIEEVIKFYNLGDKTFEIVFNQIDLTLKNCTECLHVIDLANMDNFSTGGNIIHEIHKTHAPFQKQLIIKIQVRAASAWVRLLE